MGKSNSNNASAVVSRRFSRRYQIDLVFEGIIVGLAGGGVVTLYRLSLSNAEKLLRVITGAISGNLSLMALWFVVLLVLLLLVGALMRWEPATVGSGIPQVDAEVIDHLDMPWHRVIFAI